MKGLLVDVNYESAENIKLIVEKMYDDIQLEILNQKATGFCLIDSSDYDFILTATKDVNARLLLSKIRSFIKTVVDKSADYVSLNRYREIILVDRNKILGIEVNDKHCMIHTTTDIIQVPRITLTNLLEAIESPQIVRCHKSYAVNVKYVKGFKRETRNRWFTLFKINTNFDCRVTDIFMEDVMKTCSEYHGVNMIKRIGF